jgi:hypothetical protein
MDGHRMTSRDDVVSYMQAGNATFTLVSTRSGERFTYKVRESKDGKLFFVSLLTGSDNTSDYAYLGIIRDGKFSRTAKSRIGADAPSYKAFDWFWRKLEAVALPEGVEFWHEGRCGRCGRALTVPESIDNGIGPECARRVGLPKARGGDPLGLGPVDNNV